MDKNYKIVVRHEDGNKDFDEVSIQELSNKIISKLSFNISHNSCGWQELNQGDCPLRSRSLS